MKKTIVIVRCPARHLGETIAAGHTWRGSDWSRKLVTRTELDGATVIEITEPAERNAQ